MKKMFLIILLFPIVAFGQQINIGGHLGAGTQNAIDIFPGTGLTAEFKPEKAIFSLNTDINILPLASEPVFSFPVYLKFFILDKDFIFAPEAGIFIRTNINYGWLLGLNFEYKFREKTSIFFRTDLMRDYFKTTYPNHFGGSYKVSDSESFLWFKVGLKWTVFQKISAEK